MKLENIGIGLVVFCLVITIGFNLYFHQATTYNLPYDSELFGDSLLNTSSNVEQTYATSKTQQDGQPVSAEDTEASLAKSAIPTSKNVFDYTAIFGTVISNISIKWGIPKYIVTAFITIIGILAVVYVMYMIRGFKPQD